MATSKKKTQSQTKKAPKTPEQRMYGDGAPVGKTTAAAQPAAGPTNTGAAASRSVSTGGRGSISLERQYAYVMADLKRLAIVAAGMFAFLLTLGFILR